MADHRPGPHRSTGQTRACRTWSQWLRISLNWAGAEVVAEAGSTGLGLRGAPSPVPQGAVRRTDGSVRPNEGETRSKLLGRSRDICDSGTDQRDQTDCSIVWGVGPLCRSWLRGPVSKDMEPHGNTCGGGKVGAPS